jgi:WhiB family redox-sensing transcriptional regulator
MTVPVTLAEAIAAPKLDNPLCAQVDPAIFFPGEPGNNPAAAKRICAACDDRLPCLQWALDTREPFAIYGGMTAHERRTMTSRRRPGRKPGQTDEKPREISAETRARMAERGRARLAEVNSKRRRVA